MPDPNVSWFTLRFVICKSVSICAFLLILLRLTFPSIMPPSETTFLLKKSWSCPNELREFHNKIMCLNLDHTFNFNCFLSFTEKLSWCTVMVELSKEILFWASRFQGIFELQSRKNQNAYWNDWLRKIQRPRKRPACDKISESTSLNI